MSASIALINRFRHPVLTLTELYSRTHRCVVGLPILTPKVLNSKAQCREAHAGLPITGIIEPQRGSTGGAEGANEELGIRNEELRKGIIHCRSGFTPRLARSAIPRKRTNRIRIQHLAFTPKVLNSKAQCREAHAGLPITGMIEPQRGSTRRRGRQ